MKNTFNEWTPILKAQPPNLLTVTVNSAQLRGLLHKIPDPNSVAEIMHFGTLIIHGQTDIYKTLQAIKLALHQARSDDPKLASVAVCRFQNEPNDQAEQLLICATNAAWSKHAAASSPAYVAATAAMPVIVAIQTQNTVLNPMLMNAPGNELQTMVDGTALRALLEKIPYPTSASPATPAPAASTHS
ncbi:MAG: hypothetical protein ACRETA_13810 [Gammaproteobacteria bacterium]